MWLRVLTSVETGFGSSTIQTGPSSGFGNNGSGNSGFNNSGEGSSGFLNTQYATTIPLQMPPGYPAETIELDGGDTGLLTFGQGNAGFFNSGLGNNTGLINPGLNSTGILNIAQNVYQFRLTPPLIDATSTSGLFNTGLNSSGLFNTTNRASGFLRLF